MSYVRVQFRYGKDNKHKDVYAGYPYTYRTHLPLKVGDKVIVPTKNGPGHAKVLEVNVPEISIERWIVNNILEITEYDTEDGEDAP